MTNNLQGRETMVALSETPNLLGLFIYAPEDDRESDGAMSLLRAGILNELRAQLGRSDDTLRLWQDLEAIALGPSRETEIDAAVAEACFIIPIVTPRMVLSDLCRSELDKFLGRERDLGRDDLVFPVLFIDVGGLEEVGRTGPTLDVIRERGYADLREFRYDPGGHALRRPIARFCAHVVRCLRRRGNEAPITSAGAAPRAHKPGREYDRRSANSIVIQATERIGPAVLSGLFKRLVAFDEAKLPIELLATYAIGLSTFLTCGAFLLLEVSDQIGLLEVCLAAAVPGVAYGTALAKVYWILGAVDRRRLVILMCSVTLGWLLAVFTQQPFFAIFGVWARLFPGDKYHPLEASMALAVAGLAGSLGVIGGLFVVDRTLLSDQRRVAILICSAVALGACSGAALGLQPSGFWTQGLFGWASLTTWQIAVAFCIFHGRREAIIRALGASTLLQAVPDRGGRHCVE